MEKREQEILYCRAELTELKRRADVLEMRLEALEGKVAKKPKPKPVQAVPVVQAETRKQRNLEGAIGRNLFAVLASVLVLIGVGVFISTIYEQIPEIVKIAAIYLFGFGLLGVGLFLYRKNSNRFWLGVASCGLAELLVSIITSHSYFGVLPLLPTFALVLVWIAGSFALTRFHPTVFKTIGFVGFLISIGLGLSLVDWTETGIYLTLLAAYTVLSVFFMVTNRNYVVMNSVMAFCAVAGLWMFRDLDVRLPEDWNWLAGVLMVCILGIFQVVYAGKGRLHRDAYPMFSALTLVVAASYLSVYRPVVTVPLMGLLAFVLWVVQNRWGSRKEVRWCYTGLVGVYLAIAAAYQLCNQPQMWWFVGFTAVAYGLYWLTKQRDIAWLGLLCFALFYSQGRGLDWEIWAAVALATLLFRLCGSQVIRRDTALQCAWYVVLFRLASILQASILVPLLETGSGNARWEVYQIGDGILYAILAVTNVGYLHHLLKDREKILRITWPGAVIMVLQAYVFLQCMNAVDSRIWYVTGIGILSSLLILSYSLWYTFKIRGSNRNLMIWQFIKFTLYCWAVLAILESSSILVHISLLLVAILAVVLGFKLGHKAVRIYGLVLSLVDVVSLVLFNIDYGDSLQLAGGIVLCGALCFVISFLYSRLSKVF